MGAALFTVAAIIQVLRHFEEGISPPSSLQMRKLLDIFLQKEGVGLILQACPSFKFFLQSRPKRSFLRSINTLKLSFC